MLGRHRSAQFLASVAIIVALLTACASPVVWSKPGLDQSAFQSRQLRVLASVPDAVGGIGSTRYGNFKRQREGRSAEEVPRVHGGEGLHGWSCPGFVEGSLLSG
jgi:hypothetical protein